MPRDVVAFILRMAHGQRSNWAVRRVMVALAGLLVLTGCSASGWHDAEWWAGVQAATQAGKEKQSPEAEARWQQALAEAERSGPDSWQVAYTLRRLALFYESQGRDDEAERTYKQVLAICERTAPTAPAAARAVTDLAHLYHGQGRYSEAESLYRRALPMTEKAFGPTHRNVDVIRILLASLYDQQGRYAEAEVLYKQVLANEPSDIQTLRGLIHMYETQRKYAEAEPLRRRLVAYWETKGSPQELSGELEKLAALLRKMERPAEASEVEARAEAVFPEDRVEVQAVTAPEVRRLPNGVTEFEMTATVRYRLLSADVARLQLSALLLQSARCLPGTHSDGYPGQLLPISRGRGEQLVPVRWKVKPGSLDAYGPGERYATVQLWIWYVTADGRPSRAKSFGWAREYCYALGMGGSGSGQAGN